MATTLKTITYLMDQLVSIPGIRQRKMFGEYAVYVGDKVVALVCDDQLFVKPTEAGRDFLGQVIEKPAYPGAKPYFWIDGETWDDSEWLAELVTRTASEVPNPKPKSKTKPKRRS